jgi:ribokinase
MARVYVAGSINMDVVARAARHPRPSETVAGTHVATYPGGKGANQAIAATRMGANTALLGKLGTDTFGYQLRDFLHRQGVQLDYLQQSAAAATGVALIVVTDTGENSIVVVPGANALLEADDLADVPIAAGDVVLSQFEIPLRTIEQFFARARRLGATTILNPAPAQSCRHYMLALADVLILNETELAFFADMASIAVSSLDAIAAAARCLRVRSEQIIIATLGAHGALAILGEQQVHIAGHRVRAVDTTAAGDTFAGATAARLAEGFPLERALRDANAAAAICVQRPGAAPSIPTAAEVEALLSAECQPQSEGNRASR